MGNLSQTAASLKGQVGQAKRWGRDDYQSLRTSYVVHRLISQMQALPTAPLAIPDDEAALLRSELEAAIAAAGSGGDA